MLRAPTVAQLSNESISCLLGHLPGVRDGDEEAIHQARVETRRAREVVALAKAADDSDMLRHVERTLQRAGRALGRARDADVVFQLVQDLEARFRGAANVVAILRASAHAACQRMRRKAIKRLERAELESLPGELGLTRRGGFRGPRRADTRRLMREHLADRATELRSAVTHAGGVRFDRRLHDVRIAAKRLRYALELADRLSVSRPRGARRVLSRTQEALGQLHDRDVLLDVIREVDTSRPDLIDQRLMIEQFVTVDADRAHAAYLAERPNLEAVCDACEAASRPWIDSRGALVAASAAAPAVLLWFASRDARERDRPVLAKSPQTPAAVAS